jgi:prepilin-type N-terminal cleavage/methylation domain-containing protein
MKQRGFTLIEMMFAVVMLGIVATLIAEVVGATNSNNNISYGINGMTESRCIEGYKFIIGKDGSARQILDELGKGAKCQKEGM